ncbi:MAG: TlpA family protein disulfide reductase [Candidatus Cloacimonetes bacterium]|nr:TlpA family protein disulfide reductase [Candidatus Cloacimonadota bacterium]
MIKKIMFIMILVSALSILSAQAAPSFMIELLDGTSLKSEDLLAEGPIFLDFWATWCQPCLRSMPKWSDFAEKYPDMQFYGISIDKPRDKTKVVNQVKSAKYAFQVGFDPNKELAGLFNVGDAVPQLFIISQTGEIVFEKKGFTTGDEVKVEEAINKVLKESDK